MSHSCDFRCVLALCAGVVVGALPAQGTAEESVAEVVRWIDAALVEAEEALSAEAARLDELAERQLDRTLHDGTPSAGQGAAIIRLVDLYIRRLEGKERDQRAELESALSELRPDIDELAVRLSPVVAPVVEGRLERSERVLVQHGLAGLGFDPGPADGIFGVKTREAIRAWQSSVGYEATGAVTGEQAKTLIGGGEKGRAQRVEAALGLEKSERVQVQQKLARLGFDPGPISGTFERKTRVAIRSWQSSVGDEETGFLTRAQADALRAQEKKGEEPSPARPEETEPGLKKSERLEVQRGLARLGFDPGPVDGVFGEKTRKAIRAWQSSAGDEATGFPTRAQVDALRAKGKERKEPSPAQREEEALALKKSERILVQRALALLEFDPDADDGSFGRKSRLALTLWQTMAGYDPTGYLTREQSEALIEVGRGPGPSPLDSLPRDRFFRDCRECPEMVVVPPGAFTMGSPASESGRTDAEGPAHSASFDLGFAVGVYEVTRREFRHFVSATGHRTDGPCWSRDDRKSSRINWENPGFPQTDRDPVVCVAWEDSRAYADWLSRKTGKRYRVLDEWRWEYSARAGTRTARYWGERVSEQCRYANGAGLEASPRRELNTVCRDHYKHTAPAGSFHANRWGLHDMLGNVWEWTSDCWTENYEELQGDCSMRVLRGGAWDSPPSDLRSARRTRGTRDFRAVFVGFRVTRALAD